MMTVNRRTKKSTSRQPAAPKTASTAPSKTVEVDAVVPIEETPNPTPDPIEPAPSEPKPVVAKVQPEATTQSTTEGSHAMSQEEAVVPTEPKPAKAKAAAKSAIVPQSPSLTIWDRPVMPDQMEIIGTLQMAGVRPVAASTMTVFGTYLNGRPIEASALKLYDELPGASPIFFSDFHAVEGLDLPGGRPVMASAAGLMSAEKLPGDRPIFSNDIDNAYELMGFID